MSQENIFAGEWRDCLRAHYINVIRTDPNLRNHESVKKAFLRPNGDRPPIFSESELHQLYLEATMRAEDMPDDFIPPAELLAEYAAEYAAEVQAAAPVAPVGTPVDEPMFQAHPLECQCPACVTINLVPHDDDGQPLDADARAELSERQAYAADDDSPAPTQLSLF